MQGRNICHIDLFDSYRATEISLEELVFLMRAHFPLLEMESELKKYNEALEYLHFHSLRHAIKYIHEDESKVDCL